MELTPGRKYRGSGWVNEYGEVHFRPQQTGTKPTNLHLVLEHETFSIYESKEIFKVMVKFDKVNFSLASATRKMLFILAQIKTYLG